MSMNEQEIFSNINTFLRENVNFNPKTREEYEEMKKKIKKMNDPLKLLSLNYMVRKKNGDLTNFYKKIREIFKKNEKKGLVDITSEKVKDYLDLKLAANTPLPETKTLEVEAEAVPVEETPPTDAVSCKNCFGRFGRAKKKEGYDEFYGGKSKRKTKKRKYKKAPKNTRVFRCVQKVKKKHKIGAAIAICQSSTKQGYRTGRSLKGGKRRKKTRKKRGGNKYVIQQGPSSGVTIEIGKWYLINREDRVDVRGQLINYQGAQRGEGLVVGWGEEITIKTHPNGEEKVFRTNFISIREIGLHSLKSPEDKKNVSFC